MEYSNLFVVLMGLGTVFAGLLCIILLVTLMSWVCNRTAAPAAPKSAPAAIPQTAAPVSALNAPPFSPRPKPLQIGRASCRERV